MIINNVVLKNVGVKREQYPIDFKPEIAFVGRSNVGKSSLINVMINRKSLARTSQNPGKTQTINFYEIEQSFYFVDLPGYGYTKISKSITKNWAKMLDSYLKKRPQLKCIVLLLDIRHKPSKDDINMYTWLKYYGYKFVIVCTKLDKVGKTFVKNKLEIIKNSLNDIEDVEFVLFSSITKQGRQDLFDIIIRHIQ